MGSKRSTRESKIKETLNDIRNNSDGEFPPDETFSPDLDGGARLSPFGFARKSPEEVQIDELLVSYKPEAGWYMKISKEVGANEFVFKKRINNWMDWADLELKINDIVKHETKKNPRSWGSGVYKVMFWNDNGVRNPKPASLFTIDASEEEQEALKLNGIGATKGNDLDELAKFLSIMNQLQGQNATSPKETLDMMTESYMKGMQIAGGSSSSEKQMNQMLMMMMMNMMKETFGMMRSGNGQGSAIDTMKDTLAMLNSMGAIGKKEDDTFSMIEKLRTFGVIQTPKENDPIEQFTKLRGMLTMFKDFLGGGTPETERPGMMETLITNHGGKLLDTVNGALSAINKISGKPQQMNGVPVYPGMPMDVSRPLTPLPQSPPISQPNGNGNGQGDFFDKPAVQQGEVNTMGVSQDQINKFAEELFDASQNNRIEKYDYITKTLGSFFGGEEAVKAYLKSGMIKEDLILTQVLNFDKVHYTDPSALSKLNAYVRGYVNFIKTGKKVFATQCNKCNGLVEFDTAEEFNADNKICPGPEGGECGGTLVAIGG